MIRSLGRLFSRNPIEQGRAADHKSEAFARALRSCQGFAPVQYTAPNIKIPRDPVNTELLQRDIEKGALVLEAPLDAKIQSVLPLNKEDSAMKDIEIRRTKATNTVSLYSVICATGLSILRVTPYQSIDVRGFHALINSRCDEMQKNISEERSRVQRELDARIACREALVQEQDKT